MNKALGFVFLAVIFGFLLMTAVNMHTFGEPIYDDMDTYMIENGQNETGANNIVTAVVFDYRGFDTLGEATVLFTAVTGVLVVLRRYKDE